MKRAVFELACMVVSVLPYFSVAATLVMVMVMVVVVGWVCA